MISISKSSAIVGVLYSPSFPLSLSSIEDVAMNSYMSSHKFDRV